MLILISPAKSLDYDARLHRKEFTLPYFAKDSWALAQKLKKFSVEDLEKLMKISPKLAQLNFDRFQQFSKDFNADNAKQALLVFNGDVYGSIQTDQFSDEDFDFAQKHLRILSGFYGVLRPLDLMQPYRLEMGTDFKKFDLDIKNLYQFWGDRISHFLNDDEQEYIINLASEEYFSAVNPKAVSAKIVNVTFKEKKGEQYKVIGIHAKKARGAMADFIIRNTINNPEAIKQFNCNNYEFCEELSEPENFVFIR